MNVFILLSAHQAKISMCTKEILEPHEQNSIEFTELRLRYEQFLCNNDKLLNNLIARVTSVTFTNNLPAFLLDMKQIFL